MHKSLPNIAGVVAVFIVFGLVFYIPIPPQFESRGILLTDELLLLVVSSLFYFSIKQKHWGWRYVGLFLTLLVFALPLLRLWDTAESTWNIVLGLLPWADATGYYSDASNMIDGGLFSPFSGRRPLFASFLAVLLKLSNQNLYLTLIVFVAINGMSAFLFAQSVQREFGPVPAALAIYLLQFFYRSYAGTTLTEQLGFSTGLVAFVFLLNGVKHSGKWLFALGLMTLTFSLMVRAGAFFILPVLLGFGVYHFVKKGYGLPGVGGIFIIYMLLPILLNGWLGRVVASPNTIPFGNFSYTLYGQAVGGQGWTRIYSDHPEINSLQEPELSQEIYRLAFDELKRNPLNIIKGIGKAWVDFIVPSDGSAFSFVLFGNGKIDLIFQGVITILFFWGITLLWKNRKDSISGLMLISGLGVFLSIPFLPPIDAGVRPYTATIAVILLPILVASSKVFSHFKTVPAVIGFQIPVAVVSTISLILSASLGGILVKITARPVVIQPVHCPDGLVPAYIRLMPGSYIQIVESDLAQPTKVPVVLIKDIHRSLDKFPYGDFAGLRKIRQPGLFAVTNDLFSGASIWIIAPPEIAGFQRQIVSVCSESISDQYLVFRVKKFEAP